MPETKKDKKSLPIAGIFFLLIVIPLSLMAFLIANGMFKLGVTIKERAVNVLDVKAQEDIKARAVNTANQVASLLMESKKDLQIATIIPSTESVYKQFVSENKKPLWIKKDGKIQQTLAPLYKEIALIDKAGNEKIKVVDGQAWPSGKLVNVSNPANTTYKAEDYFAKTKNLNKGEIYVSPVTGGMSTRRHSIRESVFPGSSVWRHPSSTRKASRESSCCPWTIVIWPSIRINWFLPRRKESLKQTLLPVITLIW
jgi:hypothetical protein